MVKSKKREKNTTYIWISVILFIIFSTVLFVNNLTDLLNKFEVSYNISLITWFGLIGSMGWLIFLIVNRVYKL